MGVGGRNKEEERTSKRSSWWKLEVGRYKQQLDLIVLESFSSQLDGVRAWAPTVLSCLGKIVNVA